MLSPYQRQMIIIQKLLCFHKCSVILEAVRDDSISFHTRMKCCCAGNLQELLCFIRIQFKSKGKLQDRIAGRISCPGKQLVSKGRFYFSPPDHCFRFFVSFLRKHGNIFREQGQFLHVHASCKISLCRFG